MIYICNPRLCMLMARSRATCSTQMCLKQNKMCVMPSPLTGSPPYYLFLWVRTWGRRARCGCVREWACPYMGVSCVHVTVWGRSGEGSIQLQVSLFPSTLFSESGFSCLGLVDQTAVWAVAPGSARLRSSSFQCWDYKKVPLCLAFRKDPGDRHWVLMLV